MHGAVSLQNSHGQLDVLLARWRELVARLERGELVTDNERRAALGSAMRACEDSQRATTRGIALMAPLQEFAWDMGAPT